jgi:hypothetical protein
MSSTPRHGSDEINFMKHDEAIQRLQSIKSQGLQVLRLLDEEPRSAVAEDEIRNRTAQLRGELESEYTRTLPTRAQKFMSIFELSIYSPTIEETWKDSGIRRLKLDEAINRDVLHTNVLPLQCHKENGADSGTVLLLAGNEHKFAVRYETPADSDSCVAPQ